MITARYCLRASIFSLGSKNFRTTFVSLLSILVLVASAGIATANTISVPAGGDFQSALYSAQPGDTIVLAAGATYTGPFTLPVKSGSAYITIQTSGIAGIPAAGIRVSPAHAGMMSRIISPNYESAISTAAGAHHFRFVGIEFTVPSSSSIVYNLIDLGSDAQQQSSQVPHHITFDRCYVHGHVNQAPPGWTRNGFAMNASYIEILDSHLSDFKLLDNEGHAIVGWNGPGPFKIVNNFIEASGINVMFGGAWAFPGMNPADLEFRRNHVSKRPEWRGVYSVKNLFELKDMKRAVIDGNLFEYNWAHAQPGYAIVFTPASLQSGPQARVEDIQFTNNIVRHTANGINMTGRDYGDPSYPNIPVQTNRITIKNNLFDDIGGSWGDGRFLQLTSGGGPDDMTVDHNTIIHTGTVIVLDSGPQARFVFNNNLMSHNAYGIIGVGSMGGGIGSVALNAYAPGNVFRRNVIAGANQSQYPTDNFYPASISSAAFMNGGAGNYRLSSGSPYRNAGTDGKDIGCDFDQLNAAMAGTAGPDPTPTPTPTPTPSPSPSPSSTPPVNGALIDNFDDNAIDPAKWIYNTIQGAIYAGPSAWDATVAVIERNQRLEISPRSNVGGDHYNGYVFANSWNLTNARASVEVRQTAVSSADTNLAVCLNATNFYMISVELGQLRFEQVLNGSRSTTSVAYNATQHRFWRIRHEFAGDLIVFETSADGQTWNVGRTLTRQIAISSLRAEISAGTWQAIASPGMAIFDNFRLESNTPESPLASPLMVGNAYDLAFSMWIQRNPDAINGIQLALSIDQAYTAFVGELTRFSAAPQIDMNLRSAYSSALAITRSSRQLKRKRLGIAMDYLTEAVRLMSISATRTSGANVGSQLEGSGIAAAPANPSDDPATGIRRGLRAVQRK
jgi:hypothetical protein